MDDELECMAGTSDVRHSSLHMLERQAKDSTSKKTADIAGHSSESSRRSDMSPAKTDTGGWYSQNTFTMVCYGNKFLK